MRNFWSELKKPILCLAPMADVTDAAFRYIIAKYSKQITPHEKSQGEPLTYVTYTEFVSVDGLVLAPEEGKRKLLKNLEFDEIEHPIVAQIFGSNPENIYKAVQIIMKLGPALSERSESNGFDGVDINMGCPDRSVEKQGAGAALMKNPELAKEIILAAKSGVKDTAKKLNKEEIPISVKTRIGYNKNELETWLPKILETEPAAIIIHARTRKEMSKVPAKWEYIKKAVEIRDTMYEVRKEKPLIIGNGDVLDVEDVYQKCAETGADGAMLGRAVFGNPWLFANSASAKQSCQIEHPSEALAKADISDKEKVRVLIEHIKIFDEKFSPPAGGKSFDLMKKHFKSYLSGIPGTKSLREKLMQTKKAEEAIEILAKSRLPAQ